ncbi:MAG: DNA mismatch repair protein MutS, partial [Chlamydiia bacterium]|nr:DNA mismatch repair protein MutS [Chlamydiia bacterium]
VGYNKVFGYYIEVSTGQAHLMPEHFQRRQTLVNNERFISPELKDYEAKVLTAQDRIAALEGELFQDLRDHAATFYDAVMRSAGALAEVDCISSLAHCARQRGYIQPIVDERPVLEIRAGRHPVIEVAHCTEAFVPNDTELNDTDSRLHLITGPNMAGKSTYIRQVALLTIMAQIGSYLPAESAHIGLVDKVFTRIGASDDLSRGQSTFMV